MTTLTDHTASEPLARRDAAGSLAGRVVLVTGAGSGIGRAIALALSERGSTVWLSGRRADALEATAAAADGRTATMRPCAADLTQDSDIARLRDRIEGEGGLDAVVHSASIAGLGTFAEASVADLDAQYRTNLRAPYELTRALLPLLRAGAGGDVVFVNSTAALGAPAQTAQYAATKAALRAVADSLRAEVNDDGVRVMSIFPGRTATPLQEQIHAHEQRPYHPERLMQAADVASMVAAALELPRTAEVMEIVMRPFLKPAAR